MAYKKSRPCAAQAFTLLELLLVLSIIVLLASLLLPGIRLVRDAAQSSRCSSQMRQIGGALLVYSQESDGILPPVAILPYPSAVFRTWTDHLVDMDDGLSAILNCPARTGIRWSYANAWNHSYLINDQYYNLASETLNNAPLSRVSGTTVVIADGAHWYKFVFAGTAVVLQSPAPPRWYNPSGGLSWPGELVARHGRRVNVACADGHVQPLDLGELSTVDGAGRFPLLTRSSD